MNGVALGIVAGGTLSPLEVAAYFGERQNLKGYYPPGLTGMRGSHVGSFEVAHDLAQMGKSWKQPEEQTDTTYDLVVVGGGISGLAAAWLYRQQTDAKAKILILDNHDDFGGHAKRNEFEVDGHKLIGYGGSMSLEEPAYYSKVAKKLLKDISIHVKRFYSYYDQSFFSSRNLGNGIYFHKQAYGVNRLVKDPFPDAYNVNNKANIENAVGAFPVQEDTKKALIKMLKHNKDYLAHLSDVEKVNTLRSTSYTDFLQKYAGITQEGAVILRDKLIGVWAVGWDALSALEGARLGMPGTGGLKLSDHQIGLESSDEPFIFHFPDGNAGVARALVRGLIPSAVPGTTMEDLVTSRVNYAGLDLEDSNVRIRLNSTAVNVRHDKDGKKVDVTYIQNGKASRVRGRHVILGCYNNIIPYICPEVPAAQKKALEYAVKAPLVYLSIAIRNWQAFSRLGYESIFIPKGNLMNSVTMDYPVSMGKYNFTTRPDQPTVLHGNYIPSVPDEGLNAREQFKIGRQKLYQLSFADFEADIFDKMDGALSAGGFDAERDIAAITINRWPHGYAYEYMDLSDSADWGPERGPHIAGREQIGRISIANSDASASAYIDGAIDAAARAVDEQIALG